MTHGGNEAIEVHGLLEILGGLEARRPLRTVVSGSHADDGHVSKFRLLQLASPKLVTAHHRHHEVEQNHRGTTVLQGIKGFAAVGRCLHQEPLGLQQYSEHLPEIGVVFDDENGLHYASCQFATGRGAAPGTLEFI
jgi:PII-like signaling protein